MPSQAQIDANRKNSLASTGPKTAAGKSIASLNAVKDGIHANLSLAAAEDAAAFEPLLDGLLESYDPRNQLETHLVYSIAMSYWRLGRVLRAEAARIDDGADLAEELYGISLGYQADTMMASFTTALKQASSDDGSRDIIAAVEQNYPNFLTLAGTVGVLVTHLDRLVAVLRATPIDAGMVCTRLILFSADESELGTAAARHIFVFQSGELPSFSPEECTRIQELATSRRAELELLKESLDQEETAVIERRRRAVALPDEHVADGLLRYEKTIVNHLHRDMATLDRRRRLELPRIVVPDPTSRVQLNRPTEAEDKA